MKIEELYLLYKECRSISTDSRKLIPGSMFFALKGENFNGNQFALKALENGCSYAVVDETELPKDHRLLVFPDVLAALQELAQYHRNQLKIPFIGITGSNGKTTSKELIATVLSRRYKVCATQGNLNNHIGVPLTLLSVNEHDIAIIEMGANHIGEIAMLSRIANPDFGLITNIGRAHLEGFGSPEGVVTAKSELYEHLAQRKAFAFVDSDNNLLQNLAREKKLECVYYGSSPESLCSGEITDNAEFLRVKISLKAENKVLDIQTSLIGDYNLSNLLAAACIGSHFSVSPEEIADALTNYNPTNSRSQLVKTAGNKVVLDSYNANPSSMEGALKNFLSLQEEAPKMVILGDMLELGIYSHAEHRQILDLLKKNNFASVILVGPEFCSVSEPESPTCFKNVEDAIEHFRSNPVKDHSILLKGSRGIRLEKLMDVL